MRTDSPELQAEIDRRRAEVQKGLTEAIVATLRTGQGRQVWIWIRDVLCLGDTRAPPLGLERFEGRRDVAFDLDKAIAGFPDLVVQIGADRAAFRADEVRFKALLRSGDDNGSGPAAPDERRE